MNINELLEKLIAAKEDAEARLGFDIPGNVVAEVLEYTIRKCEANGKGEDYLPLLFKDELKDYYMRMEINAKGSENHVRYMSQNPV